MKTITRLAYLNFCLWLGGGLLIRASNRYGFNLINVIVGLIFVIGGVFLLARYFSFLSFAKHGQAKSSFLHYEKALLLIIALLGLMMGLMICSRLFGEKMSIFG